MNDGITISPFSADQLAANLRPLGDLLHACVQDGASVGFVLPYSAADAELFWSGQILPALRAGGLSMLVARRRDVICATVLLAHDTPPNQPHRADVRKLLVLPAFRRQGIAQALMAKLEQLATRLGRTLLTLDTRSGDTAEPLYTALGYHTAGQIPGYCRDPHSGHLDATTLMYKIMPAR